MLLATLLTIQLGQGGCIVCNSLQWLCAMWAAMWHSKERRTIGCAKECMGAFHCMVYVRFKQALRPVVSSTCLQPGTASLPRAYSSLG